jgi:hypothetical protein
MSASISAELLRLRTVRTPRYVALGVLAIVAILAAMQTRHGGRTSWPKSAMRLAPPIPRTPGVSQRSGMGAGCVSDFVFTAETLRKVPPHRGCWCWVSRPRRRRAPRSEPRLRAPPRYEAAGCTWRRAPTGRALQS